MYGVHFLNIFCPLTLFQHFKLLVIPSGKSALQHIGQKLGQFFYIAVQVGVEKQAFIAACRQNSG